MTTLTKRDAIDKACKFDSTLQVIHSIDTKDLKPQGELFIDLYGNDNYSDPDHNVHLGISGIYQLFGKYMKNEADLYSAINYVRIHECCHLYYTGGRSWKWAITAGMDRIYEYIATQEGYLPNHFKKSADSRNFEVYLTEKYGLSIVSVIGNLTHFIANSLEDGRIERIHAAKEPGFAKTRLYYRGTCFWNVSEEKYPAYKIIENNVPAQLSIILSQILSLATCQVYQKGFVSAYANTPLMDKVQEIMPYIAEGYMAKTTRGMAEATHKICVQLAPMIYETAKAKTALSPEMYKQIVEQILKQIADMLANSADAQESFGDSDKDAKEDDTDSANSAFPFSDLEITLPDEQYDKLREKMKDSDESGQNGIRIKREHPLEEENSDDSDSSQSSTGSGENSQDSEHKDESDSSADQSDSASSSQNANPSKQSESSQSSDQNDQTNASSQQNSSSEEGEEADSQSDKPCKAESSDRYKTDGAQGTQSGDQKHSGKASYSEAELKKAMKEAAQQVNAEAQETVESINTDIRTKTHSSPKRSRIVRDQSDLVSSESMKDIADFTEQHREYKVTDALPPVLQAKGRTLNKELDRYFKTLREPDTKNRRSGALDRSALSRLAKNKTNVFMKKGSPKTADGCVYILIDNSGSMEGVKRRAACKAAAVIEEGFKGLMPMKIVAFDSVGSGMIVHEVVKNWDESLEENCCWNYCLKGRQGCGNEDDKDIRIATREILKRPEFKKIIIILSDGAPSDTEAVKRAVDDARRKGIQISSIYFEEGTVRKKAIEQFEHMYTKDYVCCPADEISTNLSRIMKKFAHSR